LASKHPFPRTRTFLTFRVFGRDATIGKHFQQPFKHMVSLVIRYEASSLSQAAMAGQDFSEMDAE
jgi:hypothetical protein